MKNTKRFFFLEISNVLIVRKKRCGYGRKAGKPKAIKIEKKKDNENS